MVLSFFHLIFAPFVNLMELPTLPVLLFILKRMERRNDLLEHLRNICHDFVLPILEMRHYCCFSHRTAHSLAMDPHLLNCFMVVVIEPYLICYTLLANHQNNQIFLRNLLLVLLFCFALMVLIPGGEKVLLLTF
jgi:hypothetical protein